MRGVARGAIFITLTFPISITILPKEFDRAEPAATRDLSRYGVLGDRRDCDSVSVTRLSSRGRPLVSTNTSFPAAIGRRLRGRCEATRARRRVKSFREPVDR